MWNCCPERYGKFQSDIPNTSGAICPPPPSEARVKIDILYFCIIIFFYKSPMTTYLTFVPKHKYQCFGTLIKVKVISDHQVIKVK